MSKKATENKGIQTPKKLQTKSITGKTVKEIRETADGPLYQVAGIATGFKSGESNYGPWEALTGKFRAINVETGEIFESGILFLPECAHLLLAHELLAGSTSVAFAGTVGKKANDELAIGYEYTFTSNVQPTEKDEVTMLMERAGFIPETSNQIEAPKSDK